MAESEFTGVWQMPPPPYSEVDPGMTGGGGEVALVFGGWDGDQALASAEMFDPVNGQWTPLPKSAS